MKMDINWNKWVLIEIKGVISTLVDGMNPHQFLVCNSH